jgi:hypothetical protein
MDGTQVGDAGLEHLKGLKNLRNVYAENTNVTLAGATELKKSRPDCFVRH